jgi:glycopeptide antibiotics resistance protein
MPIGQTTGGLICLAVLSIILSLGLWPFHGPSNEVEWLKGRPGLEFGRFSVVIGSEVIQAPDILDLGGSVELWLRPGLIWDSATVLGFSSPGNARQLRVRQSQTNLEIQAGARLYANEVFRKARPIFLTITSDLKGTSVYLDGALVKTVPCFGLSTKQFTGRLVLGDAPRQPDSWRGQLYGLALYQRRLEPSEVLRHYLTWTQQGRLITAEGERNVALYLFQERSGNVVHNSARLGLDLQIPDRYTVVDKIFLEPFWQEFSLTQSYMSSAVKNIVGFVPLGLCFYTYLMALRVRRAALVSIVLGTTVSVIIEVLQAYLPTRDSGTTDIFTNTLGTWIGVESYSIVVRRFPKMFPIVLSAAPSRPLGQVTHSHRGYD